MAAALLKMIAPRLRKFGTGPREFVQKQGDVRLMARAYANLRYIGV